MPLKSPVAVIVGLAVAEEVDGLHRFMLPPSQATPELLKMIHLTRISKNYGQKVLYTEGSLQIRPGDKIGLVGPNGAGKTTIFRIITGEEGIDGGEVNIADRTTIGYFSQDVGEMKGRTALQEVVAGAGKVADLGKRISEIEKKLQEEAETLDPDAMTALLEEYGEAQHVFEQRGGYDLDSRAREILTGLGIGPRTANASGATIVHARGPIIGARSTAAPPCRRSR
jgi:ATP-binding cassette subfamily F protein 3